MRCLIWVLDKFGQNQVLSPIQNSNYCCFVSSIDINISSTKLAQNYGWIESFKCWILEIGFVPKFYEEFYSALAWVWINPLLETD